VSDDTGTRAVAERVFAARARGDEEAVLASFADDAVIRVEGADYVPFVGTFDTPERRRFFFMDALGQATNVSRAVRGMIVEGKDAIVLGSFDFVVDATGRHYKGDWALHLHVEDGKLTLWQMYENTLSIALAFDAPAPAGATAGGDRP